MKVLSSSRCMMLTAVCFDMSLSMCAASQLKPSEMLRLPKQGLQQCAMTLGVYACGRNMA